MTDVKISELPIASAIASPDVAPIVQGGITKQANVSLFGIKLILSVLYATFEAQNLSGSLPTIDSSQTSENDRVLLFGQTDTTKNGIWVIHEHSAWTRPLDFADGQQVLIGTTVYVISGTQYPTVMFNINGGRFDVYTLTVGTSPILTQGLLDVSGWTRNINGHVLSTGAVIFSNEIVSIPLAAPSGQTRLAIFDDNGILGTTANIIFPDSDPHIAGAGYWSGGVLTRSAG